MTDRDRSRRAAGGEPSFHLRQLAEYGYVVEAEGGTGRRRPWKLKGLGMRWTDVHEDAEVAGAARELGRVC